MATRLVQPPIPAHKVLPPVRSRITKVIKSHRLIPATHLWSKSTSFRSIYAAKVAEQSSGLVEDNKETLSQIKTQLFQALQGMPTSSLSLYFQLAHEIRSIIQIVLRTYVC